MIAAVADTHALLWYLWDDARLSVAARQAFEEAASAGDAIGVSSITLVEVLYLIERGRIHAETLVALVNLFQQRESMFDEIPVNQDVALTMQQVAADSIPEMPDRIIAATAVRCAVPVISRDQHIRVSEVSTIW